jgi:triosephosphate isomerase (TIM)
MTRIPIVGGNWKMNTNRASAKALAEAVVAGAGDVGGAVGCEIVLFPPFPYLALVGEVLRGSGIALGAQDLWHAPDGACTGEVSAAMLRDVGVTHVLAGHSERRHTPGLREADELVSAKLRAALDAGLSVILCIGETIEQREAGRTEEVVLGQLRAGLHGVSAEEMRRVVIAYEPVWAIGTGRTASPQDAQTVHKVIREALGGGPGGYDGGTAEAVRIQYGGSVKGGNAAALFAQPDIDGGLIGGASLDASEFLAIVRAAAEAGKSAVGR